jgi:hypothetical protein
MATPPRPIEQSTEIIPFICSKNPVDENLIEESKLFSALQKPIKNSSADPPPTNIYTVLDDDFPALPPKIKQSNIDTNTTDTTE